MGAGENDAGEDYHRRKGCLLANAGVDADRNTGSGYLRTSLEEGVQSLGFLEISLV